MDKETFKELRITRRYTQKQLADYLGYSSTHVSHIEQGRADIQRITELAMETFKREVLAVYKVV